jgi:hypothetical protein
VDNVATAANRIDRIMRIFEAIFMCGDLTNVEPVRIQLFQCQLTTFVVVTPGGFDGDVFIADLAKWEIWENRDIFALNL